jgi:hypothetical protein
MERNLRIPKQRGPAKSVRNGLRRHASEHGDGERGAILILALAYIIVVSLVVAALTTWASGDLNNSTNYSNARGVEYSMSSAAEAAINSIRYTPMVGSGETLNAAAPGKPCWGNGTTASTLQLPQASGSSYIPPSITTYCSTLEDLGSANTRTVTIFACLTTTPQSQCGVQVPYLQAIVVFDDYPTGGAYNTGTCSTYCGEDATLESWEWSTTAGLSTTLPNSITVLSTPPAIPLVGNTYTTQSSATSGDTVAVTSATTSICSVNASGVVSFLANGTCTINFNDAGNANYSGAIQQTQTMTVGPLANSITVTSTPSSPTQGGPTYTPVASATSGDTVVVTSSTPSVCTVSSGVVSFVGNGTNACTLDFNDPGNTNYAAATQVTQTFSVSVGSPAGLSINANPSPADGETDNGDSVVYTYNQTMNASSFVSGFTGASKNVYVQLTRGSGNSTTSWQVCSTNNCSTVVNLGTLNLGDSVAANAHYLAPSSTAYLNATMTMSTVSGDSVVTVTLGTVSSGTVYALSPTTTTNTLVWTPSASATSTANNSACSTTAVSEASGPKVNF